MRLLCVLFVLINFSSILLADTPPPAVSTPPAETPAQRDARMAWWREAKFGMFIHWGLYSVPAGYWNGKWSNGNGEWILHDDHIPVADYKALAAQFNPVKFDADAWVAVAKAAGMKYIVITAKHHEGFAMFKSEDPFNIVDATPFKRDPLKELSAACQKAGIKLGFYYSQNQDWTAPGGVAYGGHWDKAAQDGDFDAYLHSKVIPQLKELLTNYQPSPAVVWFDTPKGITAANAAEILPLLQQHPELIVNNRLGGGFAGDTETPEQQIPANGFPGRDWETCMTINGTWGYKRGDGNFKSAASLLHNLVDIASKGGNYLLNVGPTSEGVIPQPEIDRLKTIGDWLQVNGEAIYGTQGTPFPTAPSWGRITRQGDKLYCVVFEWPGSGKLILPMSNDITKAYLLTAPDKALTTSPGEFGAEVDLPATAPDPVASVVVVEVNGPVAVLAPPPIVADAHGAYHLTANDADLGTAAGGHVVARLDHSSSPPHIGWWTQEQDYAQWRLAPKPGKYTVSVEYSALAKDKGHAFTLDGGDAPLHGTLAGTGTWDSFQTVDAGTITLSEAKVVTLKIKPDEDAAQEHFVNLRRITLTPVP